MTATFGRERKLDGISFSTSDHFMLNLLDRENKVPVLYQSASKALVV